MKAVTIRPKATFMHGPGLSDDETMGAIEEVYADLETDVSLEEFREAVEEKVEQMAGLADEETAAMLIAHELRDDKVSAIADLATGMEEAKFLAKVRRVGDLRTFEREEGDDGHVINVEGVDETGSVRLAFWDEQAKAIDEGELEAGDVVRVQGRPKDGYNGLEVSVHHAEPDPDAEIDVDLSGRDKIADLTLGQEGVSISGEVLAVDPVRTFERDDGSEGRVANVVLGDETDRIRVTLWDDQADAVESLEPGEAIDVIEGYVREREGTLECHLGNRGTLAPSETDVSFVPEPDPIDSLEEGDVADIAGVVRSTDPIREFDRDDGSTGQVRNIRLQDATGDIRVAIWGEAADRDLGPGDTLWLGDVDIRDGWQDELEASVSWQSAIAPIDQAHVQADAETETTERTTEDGSAQLDAFEDVETADDVDGEPVSFTGTVVQTGDPLIVDDGQDAMRVEGDTEVTLGQRVTVEGERRGDRIEAESVVPDDGKR